MNLHIRKFVEKNEPVRPAEAISSTLKSEKLLLWLTPKDLEN